MQTTTLIYIILALLLAIVIGFFQYFYKVKRTPKVTILLFALRVFTCFLLLLLLINPTLEVATITNTKPALNVLVDNSSSISYFKEERKVSALVNQLRNDSELKSKFEINTFPFAESIKLNDSLKFTHQNTNITKSIKQLDELYKDKLSATVLLSDGNQTLGDSYEFLSSKKKVFPVVYGDTLNYQDIKIAQLNVNKYSYLNNSFPVEAIINYKGKKAVSVWYHIFKKGKKIFSKRLNFSSEKTTQTVLAMIKSKEVGVHFYTSSVSKIPNEKSIQNNNKSFSVEVLDEQQKGAIISTTLHPDIGALKRAIESNKKRKIDIILKGFSKIKNTDYQYFILFNPNNNFKSVFEEILSNFLVISGATTDWNFLNKQSLGFQKKAINQTENYEAFFNDSFLTFQQDDIGFNQFPPLQDKFGKIELSSESQTLLYQKITGVKTSQPLLATFEKGDQKYAALFGEGIWKWRANSYLKNDSFEAFDAFIGSLIQYISVNKKRNRLAITYDKIYPANSSINISAFYLDKNYLFDNRASLWLTLTNQNTNEVKKFPMSLQNNSYVANLEGIASGEYRFKVSVDGQTISRTGVFKVTNYNIEEQFTNANVAQLQKLANNTTGVLFYPTEFTKLKNQLLNDTDYYTVQTSETTPKELIDWKWILFLIVLFLSLEWFIRKYYGKI